MATKVIYFNVGEIEEQCEFRSDDTTEEIRGIKKNQNTQIQHSSFAYIPQQRFTQRRIGRQHIYSSATLLYLKYM